MITADQIITHCIGDYLLQSDWMATKKTQQHAAAAAHALVYSLPFLLLSPSVLAFAVILGTHFLIDRYRLARYAVWAKNFLAPRWIQATLTYRQLQQGEPTLWRNVPWSKCQKTGMPPERPDWLAVWLLIIADNVIHILINGAALRYL